MTDHTGDAPTPESRSRELAASALNSPHDGGIRARALIKFERFHDPSLITAYADVVEAARELVRHPWLKQHEALANAILALDSQEEQQS